MHFTLSYRQRFEELKRYVGFSPQDVELLRALLEPARPELPRIARQFYERAREHEEAHAVFKDEDQIRRLQRSLVRWVERVLTGPYDDVYCDRSVQIGAIHVEVGLPQRFVVAAMTLFRIALGEIAYEHLPDLAPRVVNALARILDIELALMADAYADAFGARMARLESETQGDDRLRYYVAAVELAPTIVIGLDEAGEIQLINREAQRVFGYAYDEVVGRDFADRCLVDPEGCGFLAGMKTVREASGHMVTSLELKCLVRTRAGHIRDLRGHLSRAPAGADGEAMVFFVGRDVTDEQALEARLRRSEKLAAVGTLAAGLAHEIRNPLNGAQLHLTFLRRALARQDNDELTEAVDVVSEEIQRLSHLVTDFLDFARPRELRRERLSVKAVCRRSFEMVRPMSDDSVRFELELPEGDLMAELDASMIEQVLLNLLTNAEQAVAATGGGCVTLRAFRRPLAAVIEIADDGPGLPDPGAPIFDAFYSTKDGGTGLGLSIVHRIVSDHGGDVSVESRPGATTFRVELPLSDPERGPTSVVMKN